MGAEPASHEREQRILALALRQHGVIEHTQLLALGLGPKAIAYRQRTGRLRRLHRGVYAVGAMPLTREGTWLAAVLAAGRGAALSHSAAETLWGLREAGAPRIVEVSVPTLAGRAPRPGLRIHRTELCAAETTMRDAIPVTSLARTLLDASAGRAPRRVTRLVDRAEELRVYDHAEVLTVLARRPHHPGAARLRSALAAYEEPAVTKSVLERAMLALCARAGLPTPTPDQPVAAYTVDFLWPTQRVVVETDGRETHLTRRAFEEDRARDAELTARGYRVLRFTHRQVTHEPARVADVLRRVL